MRPGPLVPHIPVRVLSSYQAMFMKIPICYVLLYQLYQPRAETETLTINFAPEYVSMYNCTRGATAVCFLRVTGTAVAKYHIVLLIVQVPGIYRHSLHTAQVTHTYLRPSFALAHVRGTGNRHPWERTITGVFTHRYNSVRRCKGPFGICTWYEYVMVQGSFTFMCRNLRRR